MKTSPTDKDAPCGPSWPPSHFTPFAAPQVSHFTAPAASPQVSHFTPAAPLRPPKFHISRPLRPRLFGFPGPEFGPFTQIRGFAQFGRPSSLNPRPCLRAKRWRTKIRAAHEHLCREKARGVLGKEGTQHSSTAKPHETLPRSTQKPPPLLEAVEEAEGHEAHLVAGEGPWVPGRGGEGRRTTV